MTRHAQFTCCVSLCVLAAVVGCESDTAPLVPTPVAGPSSCAPLDQATRQVAKPAELHSQPSDEQPSRPPALPPAADSTRAVPRDCTFDDLKFEMQKGEPFLPNFITPAIQALAGQTIRIRGYILPSFQQQGLTQFVLVRDNMECCFGPGAALYDCIVVEMVQGKSTDFTVRPVAVAGTFSIQELIGPDGRHLAIYHLAAEAVD
jgi:hypothetical protein